jgi:hypothetical protein
MQCNVQFGTKSEFALGQKKAKENLDRVYRSQDLPGANSSPALNTRNLALVPIWLLLYLKTIYIFVFTEHFYVHILDVRQTIVYNIC